MRAALAQTVSIAVLVFAVGSMFSVGLAYGLRTIVLPLREPRAVFRALVANFVLVPTRCRRAKYWRASASVR